MARLAIGKTLNPLKQHQELSKALWTIKPALTARARRSGREFPNVSGLLAVFAVRVWFCPFQGRYEVPLVGESLLFGSRELVVCVGGDGHG